MLGKAQWPVGTFAVATNDNHLEFPFSTLALNPTMCKAIQVSGQGELQAFGNIQSNSNGSEAGCGGIGLSRTGGGEINIIADDATCRSAGSIQNSGQRHDDLRAGSGLLRPARSARRPSPAPTKPALAPAVQKIGHTDAIQARCPGASPPPTETQTQGCDLAGNGGGSRGTAWLLSPGLYPAGLTIDNQATCLPAARDLLDRGGGLAVNGYASLVTVDSLATATSLNSMPVTNGTCWEPTGSCRPLWNTNGGGVLFYNSKLPTNAGGPIDIGGNGGVLFVKALLRPRLDASRSEREVQQHVDLPGPDRDERCDLQRLERGCRGRRDRLCAGGVGQVNGSSSDFYMDQIIADTFKVNGSTGTIHVLKRVGVDAIITAAGLVD